MIRIGLSTRKSRRQGYLTLETGKHERETSLFPAPRGSSRRSGPSIRELAPRSKKFVEPYLIHSQQFPGDGGELALHLCGRRNKRCGGLVARRPAKAMPGDQACHWGSAAAPPGRVLRKCCRSAGTAPPRTWPGDANMSARRSLFERLGTRPLAGAWLTLPRR
jgi:hypothetical protein